jgi:opacity protein-like surface antigen
MKKVIVFAAMSSLFFATASADQAVVTAHEEPQVVPSAPEPAPDVQPPCCCEPSFGGFSLLLGVGGSFLKNKYYVDGKELDESTKVNRLIGSFGLGYGKVFKEHFLLGAEVLVDFTKSKKNSIGSAEVKNNGISTTVGLRLGYVFLGPKLLVYIMPGVSFASASFTGNEAGVRHEFKNNKIAPELAVGLEKSFCKKFSGRLEGAYRFTSKKEWDVGGHKFSYKANEGFSVRALISYNIN